MDMVARGVLAFAASACLWYGGWALTCGPDGPPEVMTKQGPIHGYCKSLSDMEGRVLSFLGVPYALPPTGTRRFRYPEMAENRTGVLNATDYKPSCVRFPTDLFEPKTQADAPVDHSGGAHGGAHGGEHGGAHAGAHGTQHTASADADHSMPVIQGDEDCLYLNVFVPDNQTDDLPVLIWFPGHDRQYDASELAARGNIIVVTVSFRTGILGFLSVNNSALPGNYGLYDQKLSMKWVKENIVYFGGDISRVTIAGHGISGAMVGLHLLHDPGQTLFHRAISLSRYTVDFYFVRDISPMLEIVHNHLKCSGETLLKCLQNKALSELTLHQGHIRAMFPYSVIYGPTMDGQFVKKDPLVLLDEGHFTNVDYLLGGNKDDGTIVYNLISPDTIANFTEKDFLNAIEKISSDVFRFNKGVHMAIKGRYFPSPGQTYGDILLRMFSDYLQGNALISARHHAKLAKVYFFLLGQAREQDGMVPYGSLLPLVLGTDKGNEHKNHSADGSHAGHAGHATTMTGGHAGHATTMTGGHAGHTTAMTGGHAGHTTAMTGGHAGHTTSMTGGHAGHTTSMSGGHMGHTTTMSGGHMGHTTSMPGGHMAMPGGREDHHIHSTADEMEINTTQKLSQAVMIAWANFVRTGVPVMHNGINWQPFNATNPTYLEWMVNMVPENANKAPDSGTSQFWTVVLPLLNSVEDVITPTSSPGHNHGSHTTAGHAHASHDETMFGLDLQTAAEAVLALTIVVCFLFVVVVVLLVVNFVYAPRKMLKQARKYEVEGKDNRAFDVEESATKM